MRHWIVLVCLSIAATAAGADDLVRTIVPLEEVTPDLRVLGRRGDLFLVEGPADRIAGIPGVGPLRMPPAPLKASRFWTPLLDPDPRVQALADAVVWTNVHADLQWLVGLGTRYSHKANIHTVADSLENRLAALGLATEQWDFDLAGSTVPNVIATQVGLVHPDSIFVLCAHFDATCEDPNKLSTPGADDNGTGTVAVLTAARLLSVQPMGCTVKYVLFGGEEQGLWGSRLWAAEQLALGSNIAGALNFDMIGWWETGVPFNLEIETNAHSRWIADAVVECADTYAAMPYVLHEDENIWWGDHYAFWEQGYAAVNHEESWDWDDPDFNPRYHTSQDLVEFLDPAFTTGNVRVAVTAIATLAGLTGSSSAANLPPLAASLSAHPNPFNGRTRLELAVPDFTGPVQAGVYDLRGRRLRTVVLDVRDGRATATLEAVDKRGRPLTTGVYCVRAELPSGPVTAKVAYLR